MLLKPLHAIFICTTVAMLLVIALPAAASRSSTAPQHRLHIAQQQHISLEEAVARVRKKTGGRILSAKTVVHKGRKLHRIKVLLPSGTIRVFNIDASSG